MLGKSFVLTTVPRLCLLSACGVLLLPGCVRGPSRQAVSSIVPPIQWRHRPDASPADEPSPQVMANKTVTNLAEAAGAAHVTSLPDEDEIAVIEFPGQTAESDTPSTAAGSFPFDHFTSEAGAVHVAGSGQESLSTVSTNDPDGRIQQLKAALTADAAQVEQDQVAAAQRHPMQLRAEAMTHWAQELLQLGRLSEARRAALQAIDLSETAKVQYLPNEDRPRDLLERIEAALNQRHDVPQPAPVPNAETLGGIAEPVNMASPLVPDSAVTPQAHEQWLPLGRSEPESHVDDVHQGLVRANQPVLLPAENADLSDMRAAEPILSQTSELALVTNRAAPDLQPPPMLPPFLGSSSESNVTTSENDVTQAPQPPELIAPEPFPMIASGDETGDRMGLQRPTNAIETSKSGARAYVGAGIALAVIFCVVGAGLLIRKGRERIYRPE